MAAVDYFLKIDGIDGESSDDKHKGEIELQSFSMGVTQHGTHGAGAGGGAGKATFSDLHFTMRVNKASPKLFLACATGEHIKKAVLTCRKAGKDQQEYLKVTLSEALVASFQEGGSSHGDVIPVDQFSLNYAKIEVEYKPQKADGTLDAAVKAGYDLAHNKKV
jgi:type VI secretion system secreted protein Hcp